MSKKNDDFFKEKKPWSEVKDELLGCYLKPYIQKVLFTRKPIVYVDCFAGKGVFEDGKAGSPMIALNTIKDCMAHTQVEGNCITPYFIDINYAPDLQKNLAGYSDILKYIISGNYEEVIEDILEKNAGSNLFLYIDPYGIKALNYGFFEEISKSRRYNSVELLINLNSFGFIREGCRVLGGKFEDDDFFEDLVEYETTKLEENSKSVELLNKIAGGDYWQEIIQMKNRGLIDTKEAEKIFAEKYSERFRKDYAYVLNMPLRIKKGQPPKYRMVYATNHIDGCLLMVDNICNRWQLMKDIQTAGQYSLFTEDIDNNIIDDVEIKNKVVSQLKKYLQLTHVNSILADFFMLNGPICTTGNVKDVYKALEKNGEIEVVRYPAVTEKTGKPSRFFTEEKGKTVKLRWKS